MTNLGHPAFLTALGWIYPKKTGQGRVRSAFNQKITLAFEFYYHPFMAILMILEMVYDCIGQTMTNKNDSSRLWRSLHVMTDGANHPTHGIDKHVRFDIIHQKWDDKSEMCNSQVSNIIKIKTWIGTYSNHKLPSGIWKITIFNGKIHYKWSFSIATLNIPVGTHQAGFPIFFAWPQVAAGPSNARRRSAVCSMAQDSKERFRRHLRCGKGSWLFAQFHHFNPPE